MNKIVKINGKKMTIRTYNGKRILTLMDLTDIFGMPDSTMSKKFYQVNRRKNNTFVENVDFFRLPSETFYMFLNNQTKMHRGGLGGYLITESGAKKLLSKEDKYIGDYIINCYYNDFDPPKKEDKIKNESASKSETMYAKQDKLPQNDISEDILKSLKLIGNAYENLAKSQASILDAIRQENDRFLTELKTILNSSNVNNCPDPPLDIEDGIDYATFKKEIIDAANKIVAKHSEFKSTNDVLTYAYSSLRKDYGVVWEQEKKEFCRKFGRSPVNTLELEWWIERRPTYSNLLIGKLNTIYSKGKAVVA